MGEIDDSHVVCLTTNFRHPCRLSHALAGIGFPLDRLMYQSVVFILLTIGAPATRTATFFVLMCASQAARDPIPLHADRRNGLIILARMAGCAVFCFVPACGTEDVFFGFSGISFPLSHTFKLNIPQPWCPLNTESRGSRHSGR